MTCYTIKGPGIDSACDRNEYQGSSLRGKGGRCVWLVTLSPSRVNFLEILGASTYWKPRGLPRPVAGELYLYVYDEGNCTAGEKKA